MKHLGRIFWPRRKSDVTLHTPDWFKKIGKNMPASPCRLKTTLLEMFMKIIRWSILSLILMSIAPTFGAEVFLPRYPALSPDGQTVVFCFQGDLWSVSSEGGQARRLTAHEAYDAYPVFSPDGGQLAFASNRYGDEDIFLMPIQGGAPTRLTYASSTDRPGAYSPDGQTIYFASRRLFDFPMGAQIQQVPVSGGTPTRLVDIFGDEVATHDGSTFIIAEGRVKQSRLYYRGSYQRELYSWTEGSDPQTLTENRGYDRNPMVAPDGRIFWIGDQNESKLPNIYTMNADGSGKKAVTNFTEDGVRSASLGAGGKTIVIERGTSLYLVDAAGGEPKLLNILVADDAIENPVIIQNKTANATELAISSDGEEYAMIIEGEIVLVSRELGGRATVAVPGPWREMNISFRPGSADTLLFVTDRWGENEVCLLVSDDPDQSNLRLARNHKIERLIPDSLPTTTPLWSPKGDRIAFTTGNANLHIMDADGDSNTLLFEHWLLSDYAWSPDGRWIAISAYNGDFNSDILIMPSEGGEAINITNHPDYDDNPVWSADGSMLAWNTNRHSASPADLDFDVYFMYLTRELDERTSEEWKIWEKTRDKKPAKEEPEEDEDMEDDLAELQEKDEEPELVVAIDFEDIHLRSRRLTRLSGNEKPQGIDPKGDRIYFTATIDGDTDLFSVDRFGKERENITKGGTSPRNIALDTEGKNFTFLKGGQPSRVGSGGGEVKATDFSARLTIDRPAVRLQVLDEGWRTLRDRFYDAAMHGLDWPALREKYGSWVQKVGHDRDFGDVVNFMLGEVNASHMGYYPNWDSPGDYGTDGYLGLEFARDENSTDGLKIAKVLAHGPCDKVTSRLLPGDVLKTVDGRGVSSSANLFAALETRSGLPTWLTVQRDGDELEFQVVPSAYRSIWRLNYTAMEKARRAKTEESSGGRVGYVHIQGMGYANVQRFEQNLFAAADGKEALVIDVRNNGGGWTTDLLLTILTQPVHAYTVPRGGEIGYPQAERQPFFRWSKPIVVICNEGSYSNAEIFSHAIKTIGRGPVVGMETGGNVISTDGFGNRYHGYIRLPFRGWYVWGDEKHPERNHKNQEGVHELEGFIPDYVVDLTPADQLHGRDPQLDKAVELAIEAADVEKEKPQRNER
jgi:tricorn protease